MARPMLPMLCPFVPRGSVAANGDGFADFIVAAPNASAGGVLGGAAYMLFGGLALGGTTVNLNAHSADQMSPFLPKGERETCGRSQWNGREAIQQQGVPWRMRALA
jgi:hypothetical protein